MDFRDLLPLVIIGGSFSFAGAILYGAWLLGRYRGREESTPEIAHIDRRLYEVEQTMVRVTSALDRLELAHRRTALMLADQPTEAPRLGRQSITPH